MDASSSSPSSRAKKPAVNDVVACGTFVALNETTNMSAEKESGSEEKEKEHISVEVERNMDVDEEEEDDGDEARGLEGEDFTQIFKVGDHDVWETKNFSKWRKLNWLCFTWPYEINDYFFDLPKDEFEMAGYIRNGWEDPRSGRLLELKMGHSLLCYDRFEPIEPWASWYVKEASEGARVAIEFFNKENTMGLSLKFHSLSRLRMDGLLSFKVNIGLATMLELDYVDHNIYQSVK